MTEQTYNALWFWLFWGLIILLPCLEHLWPRRRGILSWDQRWTTNICFGVLAGALNSISPVSAVLAAEWAQSQGWGLFFDRDIPFGWMVLLTFVVRSLTEYIAHLALHHVPLFWRFHRVHHSDPEPNVSTSFRFHPLEYAFTSSINIPVAMAIGFSPLALMVSILVELTLSLLSHANIRFPSGLERALGYLLVMPFAHRLHHSALEVETNSNFGTTLIIWDRLFGTFRDRSQPNEDVMIFGLDEIGPKQATSFWSQLTLPLLPAKLQMPVQVETRKANVLDASLNEPGTG